MFRVDWLHVMVNSGIDLKGLRSQCGSSRSVEFEVGLTKQVGGSCASLIRMLIFLSGSYPGNKEIILEEGPLYEPLRIMVVTHEE